MTRRSLEKRVEQLEETLGTDEVEPEEEELTERQQSAIDSLLDDLSDEERALADAIVAYAEDGGEPFFNDSDYDVGEPRRKNTQAEVDYLEVICNPENSVQYINTERYEEYL